MSQSYVFFKLWSMIFRFNFRNYSKYWNFLWDSRYGNCYTFNGGINDEGEKQRVLQSYVTGPTGGNQYVFS